jgi:hypothetical protein
MVWIVVCVVCIIYWIYFMQFYRVDCPQIFLDDYTPHLKTGDMILFKAYNNFNSIFHGGYYGHVGLIWVDPDTHTPYIFETNGIERMSLKSHHGNNGVFFTPVAARMQKYKGRCYVKVLNKPISCEHELDFKHFIDFALAHMYYDYNILQSSVRKGVGAEGFNLGVNCGTLTFLGLISLGLLPYEFLDVRILHHLNYVCELTKLDNLFEYYTQLEIVDHPFDK